MFFTRIERDSIFVLVNDLIVHPAKTNRFCTEYVGSLELIVDYGNQYKQFGLYSSVCDWNLLSDKTKRLHEVLARRIKNVYLGEGGGAVSHVSN